MSNMRNDGFIILVFGRVVRALHYISPVEWVKWLGQSLSSSKRNQENTEALRGVSNFWIDFFVVLKWLAVGAMLYLHQSGWVALCVVSFLIFFNLFSYFYYHGWGSDFSLPKLSDEKLLWRDRRRLVSFLLAIAFSFLGFAYLYFVQFQAHFQWPSGAGPVDALYLSVSNSFTVTDDAFKPLDQIARWLLLAQVLNMFVFLTVLIGNSIPSVGRSPGS